jgi:hypothetical protein
VKSLPVLHELPAGYFGEESPRGMDDGPLTVSDLSGRRPLLQMEVGSERFVVRRYHRGGLFRWFFPRTSLDAERPFRELVLADALSKSGVRTPAVVAARAVRWARDRALSGLLVGFKLDLVTRRVDNAVDMAEVLEAIREGTVKPAARVLLLRAAGALIRDLHLVGFLHSDLTPRNLLVRAEALHNANPEPWIIDLDSSVFVADLTDGERRRNLRRLYRAVQRREKRGTRFLSRADYAHFLHGYDPEGRHWKEDWRAVSSGHAITAPFHWVGWMLEKLFGGGAETRDGRAVVRS